MTTICDLNDDCLVQIVKYLEFDEQTDIYQATKRGTRLRSAVEIVWRQLKVFNGDDFLYNQMLDDYLQCISDNVEVLILTNLSIPESYIFPKCIELHCSVTSDNEIKKLMDRFPSLTKLILHGDISGEFIANWTQLEEVDLHLYEADIMFHIDDICKNLKNLKKLGLSDFPCYADPVTASIIKCKQLTELKWETDELRRVHIRKLIIGLPKLRKLLLSDSREDGFIKEIAELRGQEVVTASFEQLESVSTQTLLRLTNLRTLKIIDKYNDYGFETWTFQKPLSLWRHLKTLHLSREVCWEKFDSLWDLVEMAPHLTVLSVYLEKCDDFRCNQERMERALQGRQEPITLHFNGCFSCDTKQLQHPNLKVSFMKVTDGDSFEEDLFEFEFEPLHVIDS